jgi:hypothetical protein
VHGNETKPFNEMEKIDKNIRLMILEILKVIKSSDKSSKRRFPAKIRFRYYFQTGMMESEFYGLTIIIDNLSFIHR